MLFWLNEYPILNKTSAIKGNVEARCKNVCGISHCQTTRDITAHFLNTVGGFWFRWLWISEAISTIRCCSHNSKTSKVSKKIDFNLLYKEPVPLVMLRQTRKQVFSHRFRNGRVFDFPIREYIFFPLWTYAPVSKFSDEKWHTPLPISVIHLWISSRWVLFASQTTVYKLWHNNVALLFYWDGIYF